MCMLQALNVLSHIDFGITQVVDANVGLHARIPKYAPSPELLQPALHACWHIQISWPAPCLPDASKYIRRHTAALPPLSTSA